LAERDPNGHVNFATFALDKLTNRERFYKLITKTKRMDSATTTLAWREAYETHFGIFNHDDPAAMKTQPLALAAKHPKEDQFAFSLMHRFMWKFRQYKIKDSWGYNLSEFLELPWYYTQEIFAIEQRVAKQQLEQEEEQRKREEAQAAERTRNMQQPGMALSHRYTPSNPRGGKP
jgi:hypothetical protein